MTISPVSPTEPEPSWQPQPLLRRQVTFNEHVEFYAGGGRVLLGRTNYHGDPSDNIELGILSPDKSQTTDAQKGVLGHAKDDGLEDEGGRSVRSRRTICWLSRKTFFALVIVAVFLLGALLGGVVATQIGKKGSDKTPPRKPTKTGTSGAFPTMTHVKPRPTPTAAV